MPRRPNFVDIDIEDTPSGHALTADKGVYFSADGLRRQEELLNVAHKQRRVQPSELADSYGQWIPLPEDGDGADNGVNPVNSVSSVPGNKRKEYASSVRDSFFQVHIVVDWT
jgi:hypothetical protein